MNKLAVGQEVLVAVMGLRGVVQTVANGGGLGEVRCTTGSRFTVFAEECHEPTKPLSDLDRMFCEAIGIAQRGTEVVWAARTPYRGE